MRWYLYRNETVHGPYEKEELKAFLSATDHIAREGSTDWIEAQRDSELEDIFVTFIQPDLEWYVTLKGKPTRGPFAQSALLNLLKKKEIGPDDSIRHTSWPKPVALKETKIFRYMTASIVRLEDVPPDEWKEAPKEKGVNAPKAPVAKAGTGRKFRMDFEMTMGRKVAVALVAIIPFAAYGVYEFWYRGSDMEFRSRMGTAASDCKTDEVSKNICAEQPAKCGCSEKGGCAMAGCDMYAKLKKSGVAK